MGQKNKIGTHSVVKFMSVATGRFRAMENFVVFWCLKHPASLFSSVRILVLSSVFFVLNYFWSNLEKAV